MRSYGFIVALVSLPWLLLVGCEKGQVGSETVSRCYPQGACDEAMFNVGVSSALGSAEAGATLYGSSCVACHGEDGKGRLPDTRELDFSSPVWQARWKDGELAQIIRLGKPPKMPAHPYTDEQLRDIIAHLRAMERAEAPREKPGY